MCEDLEVWRIDTYVRDAAAVSAIPLHRTPDNRVPRVDNPDNQQRQAIRKSGERKAKHKRIVARLMGQLGLQVELATPPPVLTPFLLSALYPANPPDKLRSCRGAPRTCHATGLS